jgi:phosphoribosylformylglycinamidine synthase subunit PurQ / glutaminase
MRAGVVVFPGSNCDHDTYHVLKHVLHMETQFLWHGERKLPELDLIVLPGGFSYGDYMRTGAIARLSPVMEGIKEFAGRGGYVLGICNGFQILQEAGLLPGAMLHNRGLKFVCRQVCLRVETSSPFTGAYSAGQIIRVPIAHNQGNFYAAAADLEQLERNGQVLLRYCTASGQIDDCANPNGSLNNIAGITNERKNVAGMMPHPERASEGCLGSEDGRGVFISLMQSIQSRVATAN